MLRTLADLPERTIQWLGTRLMISGAWLYIRIAPSGTRVLISFEHRATDDDESPEDDLPEDDLPENGPPPGKATDPVFIEWLNSIYRDSPESDTRMG